MKHLTRSLFILCFIFSFLLAIPTRAEFTSPLIGPDKCGDMNLTARVDVLDALFAAQVAVYSFTGSYIGSLNTFIAGGGVPTIEEAAASCINGDTNSDSSINILDALFMAQVGAFLRIPEDGNCPNTGVCQNLPGEQCLNMYGYSQAAVTGAFCQPTQPCSAQCQPVPPNEWNGFLTNLASEWNIIGAGRGCSAGPQSAPLLPDQCFIGTVGNPDVLYRDLSNLDPGRTPNDCFSYGGCVNAVINSTLRALQPGDPSPVFSCWYSDDDHHPVDFVFCRQP